MPGLDALSILIVDDHEGMRVLLRKVLERAGAIAVRDAPSGAEALRMLGDASAQLILVDRNMPEMDGLAFVQRVRANARLAGARIVMISGSAGAGHTTAVQEAGVDAVLVKPIAPRDLIAALKQLLSA